MADVADYPQTVVLPELFSPTAACNTALPVGEVVEWFDFGQFVELYATDESGTTHPLVITQDDAVLQASLRVRDEAQTPARTVDVAGGIPLNRAVAGEGAEAFKTLGRPDEVVVDDVDDLVRTGTVASGGTTYTLVLRTTQIAALRDGETLLLRGRAQTSTTTRRVWVQLRPKVSDVRVTDLDQLLADRRVLVDGVTVALRLEPVETMALLAGRTVVVRGTVGTTTRLVRLQQNVAVDVGFAAAPSVTDYLIKDLAAFLADPVVPGEGNLPFKVALTAAAVHALRTGTSTDIPFGEKGKLTLRTTPAPVTTASNASWIQHYLNAVKTGEAIALGETEQMTETVMLTAYEPAASTPPTTATAPAAAGPTPPAVEDSAAAWTAGAQPLPEKKPPALPPIPSLKIAIFLPWRQTWTLRGLSRGRLLHSLSLAPQEETTLELFTWERHRKTREQSSETESEQSFEGSDSTKDTSDVYSEVNRQRDFQWQVSGSLKATYRPVAGEISLGADASAQNKGTMGEIGKTTQNRVHETVVKATTKVRAQRVTKISETVEFGSEERITRKVRNPNGCRTLNLDYYEVLAHYGIETSFLPEDARLCAFVPNPLSTTELTDEIIRRNETALNDALLESALREGFDAIRMLEAYKQAKEEHKTRRADAAAAAQMGAPKAPPPETTPVAPAPAKEELDVVAALKDLRAAARQLYGALDIGPALGLIAARASLSAPVRLGARRWLFRKLVEARFSSFATELEALAKRSDAEMTVDCARQLVGMLPAASANPTLGGLGELSDADKETAALGAAIRRVMAHEWDWAWWSGRCREESLYSPDDLGIPGRAQRLAEKWQALDAVPAVEKAMEAGDKAKGEADARQDQQAAEDVLEMKFPLEQIARARERAAALRGHLGEHWSYYRYVLFQALPPGEQLERLLVSSSGVLRAGMFEPRVVSVHGDQLAVPINTANYPGLEAFLANMLSEVRQTEPGDSTVLLPTPGMSIESRLGRCSGCEEFIEKSRTIELRRLTAEARLRELEADRYAARLDKAPPELGDPETERSPIEVHLMNGATPR
jgi:hypothetical protein